jgi:hypothetical protein
MLPVMEICFRQQVSRGGPICNHDVHERQIYFCRDCRNFKDLLGESIRPTCVHGRSYISGIIYMKVNPRRVNFCNATSIAFHV